MRERDINRQTETDRQTEKDRDNERPIEALTKRERTNGRQK